MKSQTLDQQTNQLLDISLGHLTPNPHQPREHFDPEKLQELADSIKEHGLLQPITVEPAGENGDYIIIAGERRWRAHQLLKLPTIKAFVRPSTGDLVRLTDSLIENLHRHDMNPIEEAKAFQALMEQHGLPQVEIAHRLNRSQPYITTRLALLKLDLDIQTLIATGKLSKDPRVVRSLLDIPDAEARIKLAKRAAAHKHKIATIERAARRVKFQLTTSGYDPAPDDPPAGRYAQSRSGPVDAPLWNQLAAKNLIPPWDLTKQAIGRSCRACAFFDSPDESICGECPAVLLVEKMITTVQQSKMVHGEKP